MIRAYTYLIGWSSLDKWYYGVRYKENCDIDDLWKTYYTSSERVKELRNNFGEPDVIQVRKTFTDIDEAIKWESTVLRRLNASGQNKFLNQQNGSGCRGVIHDDYMRKRKSEAMKKYWTEERRNKKSQDMIEYNKIHGTERYSKAMLEKHNNPEFKEKFTHKMNSVNKCPNKRKEAGEKIKEKWKEPEYVAKMKNRGGGRKSVPVVINDIEYKSISEAVNKTNLSYHTVRKIAGLVK